MVLRLRQHNIGYTADGFYRSDDPTNKCQSTEGGWLVIQTGLNLTMLTHRVTILQHACRYYTRK